LGDDLLVDGVVLGKKFQIQLGRVIILLHVARLHHIVSLVVHLGGVFLGVDVVLLELVDVLEGVVRKVHLVGEGRHSHVLHELSDVHLMVYALHSCLVALASLYALGAVAEGATDLGAEVVGAAGLAEFVLVLFSLADGLELAGHLGAFAIVIIMLVVVFLGLFVGRVEVLNQVLFNLELRVSCQDTQEDGNERNVATDLAD